MDSARIAAQSDPDRNYHFCRRWAEAPPLDQSGPRVVATTRNANPKENSNKTVCSLASRRLQAALRLDHRADVECQAGRHQVGERLSQHAAELREMAEAQS